ncbi:MAG: hypothetical protein ACI89R_000612 [Candidatus Azotimanducaceae bacterium]|jgi:hypothetical protein
MLLQAVRKIFIKKKIENKLLDNGQFPEVYFKEKFPSVLILVGEEESGNLKGILANELNIPLPNIELLKFCKKIKKGQREESQFSGDDFGWFGKIKSKKIEKLVKKESDVLLNYAIGNLYIDYLASISKAKFKVAYSNNDKRLYDLMINVKEPNTAIFNSELKKYLNILNK